MPQEGCVQDIETFDVVVVGSGSAGAMAALRAADLGMKVLIIEKEQKFGGTSATSGGVLWIPNHQLDGEKGDSREATLAYLDSIIGKPVTIPLYDQSGGNGNNAWYRVVDFAVVRIVSVNFQGNPKYVIVQPALSYDPTAETGTAMTNWQQGGIVKLFLSR